MRVQNLVPFRLCLVFALGASLLATGCRSTRNSVAQLPGMSWMAADETTYGEWDEGDEPSLPPPSSSATPQLSSSEGRSATPKVGSTGSEQAYPSTGYPSTGYSSPYGNSGDVATTSPSYPTGAAQSPRASTPEVGRTQSGFYGEQYEDDQYAETPAGNDQYEPAYSSAPSGTSYDQYGYDSAPRSESNTAGQYGQPQGSDAYDQYSGSSSDSAGSDSYDQTPSWSGMGEELKRGAESFANSAKEDFSKHINDVRQGTRDSYDQISNQVGNQYDQVRQSAADAVNDMRNQTTEQLHRGIERVDEAVSGYVQQVTPGPQNAAPAYDDYDANSAYDSGTAGNSYSGSGSDYAAEGEYISSPAAAAPRRSSEPWRPGSTADYLDQNSPQSRSVPASTSGQYVAPATYRSAPADANADSYRSSYDRVEPATATDQRLAPRYR